MCDRRYVSNEDLRSAQNNLPLKDKQKTYASMHRVSPSLSRSHRTSYEKIVCYSIDQAKMMVSFYLEDNDVDADGSYVTAAELMVSVGPYDLCRIRPSTTEDRSSYCGAVALIHIRLITARLYCNIESQMLGQQSIPLPTKMVNLQ